MIVRQFTPRLRSFHLTFPMVFLIQNTQNRPLVPRSTETRSVDPSPAGAARNVMLTVKMENLSLEEIETFRIHYEKLATTARENSRGLRGYRHSCDHHQIAAIEEVTETRFRRLIPRKCV